MTSSYASTVSNTPSSVSGSLIPTAHDLMQQAGQSSSDGTNPVLLDEPSLAEREEKLAALLAESELAHAELSERMMNVYEKQAEKLTVLRMMEKTLSSQAGSLLKRLQSEEQSTSQLSGIIKRYKSEHKKLLAKIANPKWEIAHHYHMTCIEHQLGHRQPHVLDVAELLPGHLRIYSLARVSSLYKRALMYYSAKSKSDRNSVSESIQESYKRLREVRRDMKEIQKMMDLMKIHMKKANAEGIQLIGGDGQIRRPPPIQRQDSGERTFEPTPESAVSPIASAADPNNSDAFTNPSSSSAAAQPSSTTSFSTAPPSATLSRRPASGSPGGGPVGASGMDAMLRQRRRMLGLGGAGGPGGSSRSMGPGMSGRSSGPGVSGSGSTQFMGAGTPPTGTTSAGTTAPSNDPLAPLNPDAIVLPTDGTAFNALSTVASPTPSSSLATTSSTPSSTSSSQSNYRMKYFKTLNLAPKLDFLSSHLPATSPAEAKKDMAESYNMDMKTINQLLSSLEATGKDQKEKAQQLSMLQQYRKRMGVESLPQPHFDGSSGASSGALDVPQSPGGTGFGDDSDSEAPDRNASPLTLGDGYSPMVSPGSSPSLAPYSPVGGPISADSFSLDQLSLGDQRSSTSPRNVSSHQTSSPVYPPTAASSSPTVTHSQPMAIQSSSRSHSPSQGLSSTSPASSGVLGTSPTGSRSSASRQRERERDRPSRTKPPSSPTTAPVQPVAPVTLFSSRSSGSTKSPLSGQGSESSPTGGHHERRTQHSSRAVSRIAAQRQTEEHGR